MEQLNITATKDNDKVYRLLDELMNGKEYDVSKSERGAYGGIGKFLLFIKKNWLMKFSVCRQKKRLKPPNWLPEPKDYR